MSRQTVQIPNAPTAGPYSHGVWSGELFYLSGQAAVDPATGQLMPGDVSVQTAQCFRNLFAVLTAAGLSPQDVIKANVYLTDMNNFAAMNAIYAQQFERPYPARTTVAVAALPLGALVNRTDRPQIFRVMLPASFWARQHAGVPKTAKKSFRVTHLLLKPHPSELPPCKHKGTQNLSRRCKSLSTCLRLAGGGFCVFFPGIYLVISLAETKDTAHLKQPNK